eukprot:11984051-Karenia_brevis.AAC.1
MPATLSQYQSRTAASFHFVSNKAPSLSVYEVALTTVFLFENSTPGGAKKKSAPWFAWDMGGS